MQNLVERLVKGLAEVKMGEITVPEGGVHRGEVVVGQIEDPRIKVLYTYYRRNGDRVNELVEAYDKAVAETIKRPRKNHDYATCPVCLQGIEVIHECEFHKAVETVFWATVESTLDVRATITVKSGGRLSIRAGWQIVVSPSGNAKVTNSEDNNITVLGIMMMPHGDEAAPKK
ncbi:MAG: hypothetical protein WCF94_02005 [bacterium]